MPVVNRSSDIYVPAAFGEPWPDPVQFAGRPHYATGSVTNAANDSSGSLYKLATVPSDGIPLAGCWVTVDAWGFAVARLGSLTDPDALLNLTIDDETVVSLFADGDADHAKRWWEVLGHAADPGGMIDIYAVAAANATGAGSMKFQFAWLHHA